MAHHIYALSINSNSAGQFCTSVLHYDFDDSGFLTTEHAADALILAWDLANRTHWRSMHPTDVTLLSYKARQVNGTGGFEASEVATGSVVGTRTGTLSASGLSPVLIAYPSNNARARGRVFLHGVSEADVIDGVFTNAFKTAVATHAGPMLATINLVGGGSPPASYVIYNRVLKTGLLTSDIFLSDDLGTIRRRQVPA